MKVVWSALAERRAVEAFEFIAHDRPHVAEAWLTRLFERAARLDRMARRGRVVPEIGLDAYRELLQAPFRLIYRIEVTRVVVLTIRHQRQRWDSSEIAADR